LQASAGLLYWGATKPYLPAHDGAVMAIGVVGAVLGGLAVRSLSRGC